MPESAWDNERLEPLLSKRALLLGPAGWGAAAPDARPVISFAGGLPDIPSLPGDLLLKATRAVVEREQKEALEYAGNFGTYPLREALARRCSELEGVPVTVEQVIVSSGAAHGIGMVCETLLDPGDTVIVESPNFPGSLRTIRSFGATMVPVPLDEDGLRVDELETALNQLRAEGRRAKFIYCIPTHQNPSGSTMPLARRERLARLAEEHGAFILEDDAYGELWFADAPPPSLFALTGGEHAIKVSSFSKIVATGLRMGWCQGPAALISRMAGVRYDMGSSPFLGRILAEMIRNGDLDRHAVRLRDIYRRKLERMEQALQRYCSAYCTYRAPAGGFFLWLKLQPGLSAQEVTKNAFERGVVAGSGAGFFAGPAADSYVRLAFSYVAFESIEEGIHLLGEAMAEVAARGKGK